MSHTEHRALTTRHNENGANKRPVPGWDWPLVCIRFTRGPDFRGLRSSGFAVDVSVSGSPWMRPFLEEKATRSGVVPGYSNCETAVWEHYRLRTAVLTGAELSWLASCTLQLARVSGAAEVKSAGGR